MFINEKYIYVLKGIIVIMLFSCFSLFSVAQNSVIENDKLSKQEAIDFRVPESKKIEKYKADNRFHYVKKQEQNYEPGLFTRILNAIGHVLFTIFKIIFDSTILSWLLIIALVLLLVFLILKIAKVDIKSAFSKATPAVEIMDIHPEKISNMGFDELIKSALENKDYRLAVRYLYLRNLRLLSDKGIIDWKPNKTNYAYLSEIKQDDVRGKFLDTTIIFDYVWYGEFPFDGDDYSSIENRMCELSKMLGYEK